MTKLYAHRGLCINGAAENTLEAFAYAMSQDMNIELDVRLTGDGVPVVFHDAGLSRLTSVSSKVSGMTLGELSKVRIGDNCRIPTLKETLKFISGKAELMVEIKAPKYGFSTYKTEKATIELLRNYSGSYMIQSFNGFTVRYCKKNLPDVMCGRISADVYFHSYFGDFVNYKLEQLTENKVRYFRKKGLKVYGWSVFKDNADMEHERIVGNALNLDGVIL